MVAWRVAMLVEKLAVLKVEMSVELLVELLVVRKVEKKGVKMVA